LGRGFKLGYDTPPEWVERVEVRPLDLLADHAHCELKAAASAQALIVKNTDRAELVRELTDVALCELEHFRTVVQWIEARGGTLGPPRPGPYAEQLLERSRATRGSVLLDRLIVAGLIEARSLERFHLLATHLEDPQLAELYAELLPSEAEHQLLFFDLAHAYFEARTVEQRVNDLLEVEARVVEALPFDFRMHSGCAVPAAACHD